MRYQIIKFKLQFSEFMKFRVNGEMCVNGADTRGGSLGRRRVSLFIDDAA